VDPSREAAQKKTTWLRSVITDLKEVSLVCRAEAEMIAGDSAKKRSNVVMALSPGRNDEDEREIKHPALVLPGQRVPLVICIMEQH